MRQALAGIIILLIVVAFLAYCQARRNEAQPLIIEAAAPCARLPNPCDKMDCTPRRPTREIA